MSSMKALLLIPLIALTACSKEAEEETATEDLCVRDNEECAPMDAECMGEGANMLPGADCLACHTEGNLFEANGEPEHGPFFTAAGTVYTDGDGSAPAEGAIVRITDAFDHVFELTTSEAGNFFMEDPLSFPLRVEVEVDGEVRQMQDDVESGSCNSCHSCDGTAANKIFIP